MAEATTPGPVLRLLGTLLRKRRAQERAPRSTTIYLFTATAVLGEARLIDESKSGAKISAATAHVLPLATYALNPSTATVHSLELAWQTGREAGYRYTSSRPLRGYVADPRLQHVRDFWTRVAA